jgi:hypothetical protein
MKVIKNRHPYFEYRKIASIIKAITDFYTFASNMCKAVDKILKRKKSNEIQNPDNDGKTFDKNILLDFFCTNNP